jgi:hypothetical protein
LNATSWFLAARPSGRRPAPAASSHKLKKYVESLLTVARVTAYLETTMLQQLQLLLLLVVP